MGDLPRLPARARDGHKGTFGTVVVVGGCAGDESRMIGAPALAALGALRAGAGLVRILAPGPILDAVLSLCPSATGVAVPVDHDKRVVPHLASAILDRAEGEVLLIGPGLGRDPASRSMALRAVQQERMPAVIDADAIHALAAIPDLWRDFRAPAVLTPHPGEFRSLARSLALPENPETDRQRQEAAEAMAQRLGCVVVLKGARTIVTDGQDSRASPHADHALAAAGTGDVLAGVIAGLIAQSRADTLAFSLSLVDLAFIGVHVHALAAARWRETSRADSGLLARELADCVPAVMATFRASPP